MSFFSDFLIPRADPGGTYLYGEKADFWDRADPGHGIITGQTTGKKGGAQSAQTQPPPTIEPPPPIIFTMPEMPEIPAMPELKPYELPNYARDAIAAQEKNREDAANRLRAGRAGTIHSSPLGDMMTPELKKKLLLGQ